MNATLVILSNTRAQLKTPHRKLIAAADKATAFEHVGHQHTRAFRRWVKTGGKEGWDGRTHLLSPLGTFALGLLPVVERALVAAGATVKVVECREGAHTASLVAASRSAGRGVQPPKARNRQGASAGGLADGAWKDGLDVLLPGKVLRPDQVDSIVACVERERGIVWAATGAGKTEVAIGLVKLLLQGGHPGTVLFLSNRKKLLRDTHARFEAGLQHEVGYVSEGEWREAKVIVGSVSTLTHKSNKARLKRFLKGIGTVIVDECHHAASDSWYRLLKRIPARVRIGLSGTPLDRGDGKNLRTVAVLGEVIYEIRAKTLIDAGMLARPTVTVVACRVPDDMEDVEYESAYVEGIVKNAWRNRRIAELCRKDGKTLVLVQHIDHGKNVVAALRSVGYKAPFLHGHTDSDTVDATVTAFRKGKHPVLVASSIFREGVDIPETDGVVIADGGQSVIKVLQQLGRGTRRKSGANAVQVYDFADMCNPYLARHSIKRIETYEREGFEVQYEE